MADQIQDGVVATLAYTLTVDGQIVDEATPDDPFDYLHGAQNVPPGLESQLAGKKIGDRVSVTLQPSEGYGNYNPEDVQRVPRSDIPDDVEVGMSVLMEDEEGYLFEAMIKEVTADTVVLDLNHELAGKVLTYNVEVIDLREAEEEELAAGIPYGYDDDDDYYDDEDDN